MTQLGDAALCLVFERLVAKHLDWTAELEAEAAQVVRARAHFPLFFF